MSQETIVNRVAQTGHFEAEGQALEELAKTAPLVAEALKNPDIPVSQETAAAVLQFIDNKLEEFTGQHAVVPQSVEQRYANLQETSGIDFREADKLAQELGVPESNLAVPQTARITHIDEAIEAPDDNIGNVASASNVVTPEALLEAIISTSGWKRSFDDEKFKVQVIAAFRHLGLDVRKHFGV